MALLKNSLPIEIDKYHRVAFEYDPFYLFGLANTFRHPMLDFRKHSEKEILDWIKENCSGYVYHIKYGKTVRRQTSNIWEFFFKTSADAIHFKLKFS